MWLGVERSVFLDKSVGLAATSTVPLEHVLPFACPGHFGSNHFFHCTAAHTESFHHTLK